MSAVRRALAREAAELAEMLARGEAERDHLADVGNMEAAFMARPIEALRTDLAEVLAAIKRNDTWKA